MEHITFDEIINAIDGEEYIKSNYMEYKSVSTDTRKIPKDSIFIALKGENFNANNFVKEASEKGASLCIVDEIKFDSSHLNPNTSIIKVENTKKALLKLAAYYRKKLNLKVIGITGSTGKTSTKDLVAAALSGKYKVFKTKGNFNNEIGLPLMIFQLDDSYDIAVLEMGMSNLNEIHNLAEVAEPDIALITNIGVSHLENLKTRENILKAKMEITDFFNEKSILIINTDNDLLATVENRLYSVLRTGIENGKDFKAVDINLDEKHINFRVVESNSYTSPIINIAIPGKHNILNTLLAIGCSRSLGMSYEEILDGLENLEVTSMRLDIVRGNKFTIIDDSYNASPDSMRAAIEVLATIEGKRKIAVLGTMRELGNTSYDLHKEIGEYAKIKGIDYIYTVGEYSEAYLAGFSNSNNSKNFNNIEEVIEHIKDIVSIEDVILVKASRSMKFENIVNNLKMINC
ncbi:UDP-N-acetylmuramoyl-tripeptide--D-alanyl-D-alanine ligase [Clostridium omnivorum]|uniref:UDP-N-acetylmuramoyl-tripeptide--D-alanyl-D-alanine ligase n=1 Tax=Clostridium omnivorum TaxID=1604902 RepID=A0ABQ5NB10_9CLOT|nr:UDP-N-acetylmuramoyl-tripeptide--D-alanyl-D-alanine ligase [Clostridium sp. E14]GLC32390.1 UDP-N-acetylmuramoyl-tripeptide--D-alanyl-D-alanine ligase [Clostridium sp. E14]